MDPSVEDPVVAGVAPAARTASSLSIPTSTPTGAGNPCATSVVSSATTGEPSASAVRTSSETTMSSLATASTLALRGSGQRPRARGRARRRSTPRRARRRPRSSRSPSPPARRLARRPGERASPRAALHDPRRPRQRPAQGALLVLVREHDVRGERLDGLPEARPGPASRIAIHEERSTLIEAPPHGPAPPPARRPPASRLAGEDVPRDEEMAAAVEPGRVDLLRAERRPPRRGRRPSNAPRPAPRGSRSTAFLPATGPTTSTPRASRPAHASSAASSSPRFPTKASVRTERRGPGCDVRRLAPGREPYLRRRVASRVERPGKPHEDVEAEVAERADEHAGNRKIRRWTASNGGAVSRLRPRWARRRLRRRGRRPAGVGASSGGGHALAASPRSRARRATSSSSSGSARVLRSSAAVSLRPCRSTSTAARTGTRSSSSRR